MADNRPWYADTRRPNFYGNPTFFTAAELTAAAALAATFTAGDMERITGWSEAFIDMLGFSTAAEVVNFFVSGRTGLIQGVAGLMWVRRLRPTQATEWLGYSLAFWFAVQKVLPTVTRMGGMGSVYDQPRPDSP